MKVKRIGKRDKKERRINGRRGHRKKHAWDIYICLPPRLVCERVNGFHVIFSESKTCRLERSECFHSALLQTWQNYFQDVLVP